MPSTSPPRRSFASFRDRDGRTVISITISNSPGDEAHVYVEDFCRIISEHGWGAWFVNKRTTRAPAILLESRTDHRQHLVARLVMREPKGRMVEPVDGDLLNLRRSNLVARAGGRGGQRKTASKAHEGVTGADLDPEAVSIA